MGKAWPEHLNALELTTEELREMRELGYDKPAGITYAVWNGTTQEKLEIDPRKQMVVHLAAAGLPTRAIAEETGYTTGTVSQVLQSSAAKEQISSIRERHYGEQAQQRIANLVGTAFSNIESILESEEEKANVKLQAATYILDQHLGKATQKVEMKGSMISTLLAQVEHLQKSGNIDAIKDIVEVGKEVPDEFDAILDANIKELTVGKRDRDAKETEYGASNDEQTSQESYT